MQSANYNCSRSWFIHAYYIPTASAVKDRNAFRQIWYVCSNNMHTDSSDPDLSGGLFVFGTSVKLTLQWDI